MENPPLFPKTPLLVYKKRMNAPSSPLPFSMLIPFSLSAKWKWKQLCLGGGGGGEIRISQSPFSSEILACFIGILNIGVLL